MDRVCYTLDVCDAAEDIGGVCACYEDCVLAEEWLEGVGREMWILATGCSGLPVFDGEVWDELAEVDP